VRVIERVICRNRTQKQRKQDAGRTQKKLMRIEIAEN